MPARVRETLRSKAAESALTLALARAGMPVLPPVKMEISDSDLDEQQLSDLEVLPDHPWRSRLLRPGVGAAAAH